MDSLTQATLGAAVAHLCWHKQLGGRKSVLAGAVLGTLPDLDIIIYPLLDEVQRLYWHRGESHSVFFVVLGSLITAWLLQRFVFKGRMTFTVACMGALLTYSTHILIDTFTTYGTQILAPLSRKGYALSNFFIIDPLFTLPLLAGVIYCCFGRRSRQARVNMVMLGLATCYTAWSLTAQSIADTRFRQALQQEGYAVTRHLTSAGPFTTFLWRHLGEVPGGYVLGYWSFFDDSEKDIEFHFIPKSAEKTEGFRGSRSFAAIDWFSQGWWVALPGDGGTTRIIDLRFTEIPASPDHPHDYWNWPFSWSFMPVPDIDPPLQAVVPQPGNMRQTLSILADRIVGGDGWLNGTGKLKLGFLHESIETGRDLR